VWPDEISGNNAEPASFSAKGVLSVGPGAAPSVTGELPLEEPFRVLLDTLSDCAFFSLDVQGRVQSWSAGAERLLGYQAPEILGASFHVFFLTEEVETGLPEQALNVASQARCFEDEGLRVARGGASFWARLSVCAIRTEGHVSGFAVMVRELSERRRAEAAQRSAVLDRDTSREEVQRAHAAAEAERARLQTILMQAPALISIRSGPEHRIDLANPRLQQLYGYRPLLGLSHEEALPELPGYKALLDDVFHSGRSVVLEESPVKMDWRRDGKPQTRYFSTTLQPLRTPEGRVEGVVTFSQDVTEQVHARKRAEAAVVRASDQHQWLEAVLDSMPMPLILVDPEMGRVTFANRAADALAGGRFPRLLSEVAFCEQFHCRGADGAPLRPELMPWTRASRGEEVRGLQLEWQLPDGSTRSLQTNARLLPAAHGHAATALVTYEDITPVKQVQEALQGAIRVRDAFLSIAGHELKTPLTTLQLQIQSLGRIAVQEGKISFETAARKVESANRQTERLAVLISQLLDVSRIHAGRLSLELQPLDLAALVREVCARFEDEAERVGAPLKVHAEGRWVGMWDRERLDQVLTNLLSNALKYGRGRPVEVSLEGDEKQALLSVRDHGIGIAEADQLRIFDRFERAVSDRHYGGLGLGLWIVREIISALGGHIRVESTPGAGSCFRVDLPVAARG